MECVLPEGTISASFSLATWIRDQPGWCQQAPPYTKFSQIFKLPWMKTKPLNERLCSFLLYLLSQVKNGVFFYCLLDFLKLLVLMIHRELLLGSISLISNLVSFLILIFGWIHMLLPISTSSAPFASSWCRCALYDSPCALKTMFYMGLVNILISPLQNLQILRQNPTESFKCNRQGVS